MSSTGRTSTESRALKLLGSGIGPEQVAAACGVSVSRISQLLSDPVFTEEVASLRFEALSKHNDRDGNYDSLEDKLLKLLEDCVPLLGFKPMELLKAISVINAAKRRGQSAPDGILNQQTVVTLLVPTKIVQKFTVNVNNQVISTGSQELLTMQSANLEKLAALSNLTKESNYEYNRPKELALS